MKTRLGKLSLIILLGALSLVFLGLALSNTIRGHDSLSWPSATGQITLSRVETRVWKNTPRYAPDLLYDYTVDGEHYTGMLIGTTPAYNLFGIMLGDNPSSDSREEVERIINRYPRGQAVTVFYDPAAPAISALEPGIPPGTERGLILGLVLGLGALVILLLFR